MSEERNTQHVEKSVNIIDGLPQDDLSQQQNSDVDTNAQQVEKNGQAVENEDLESSNVEDTTSKGQDCLDENCNSNDNSVANNEVVKSDGDRKGGKVKAKRSNEFVINIILSIVIVIFVATIIIRVFFFCQIRISQTSMYPTYNDGDRVWVRRADSAQRGQVVVFFKNETHEGFWSSFTDSDTLIIKRVVAISGDSIWVEKEQDGNYTVRIMPKDSDEILTEDNYYKDGVKVEIPTMTYNELGLLNQHIGQQNALVIDEGCFFAMGDNRPVSDDSRRSFGQIPFERLLGIVME